MATPPGSSELPVASRVEELAGGTSDASQAYPARDEKRQAFGHARGSLVCRCDALAPAAAAKGLIAVTLGNGRPRVGQAFTVYVRTDYVVPADDWLRLIAVAPGKTWFDVVGKVTGDTCAHERRSRATASRSSSAGSTPSTGVRLCSFHVRDGGGSSYRTEHTSASCFRLPRGGCPGSTSAPRQLGGRPTAVERDGRASPTAPSL